MWDVIITCIRDSKRKPVSKRISCGIENIVNRNLQNLLLYLFRMGCGLEVICLLVLYVIWDVNYFIRVVFTVGLGRLFEKKRKITDTTKIYGKSN